MIGSESEGSVVRGLEGVRDFRGEVVILVEVPEGDGESRVL